jgi:DNA-binding response OmpR family regulator
MNNQSLYILVVEDQQSIAQNIADFLEGKGHRLDFATQGRQALELALSNHYDVVVLDLNLPVMDGLEVCTQLRQQASHHVPIIMLTARDSIDDKISGFTTGADDYLTKPFSLLELEVRCFALSRRHLLQKNHTLSFDQLIIDRKTQQVSRAGKHLELHTMGYRILSILAEAYPQVVSRSAISQKLWGDEPTESDALRSHIYQLRNILDKPFDYPMIETMHGIGFVLHVKSDVKNHE